METLVLKPLQHNGEENIGMYFPNLGVLNKAVRRISKARWSRTHTCWYVPSAKEKHQEILAAFKGLVKIEQEELRVYLLNKKKKSTLLPAIIKKESMTPAALPASNAAIRPAIHKKATGYKGGRIHAVNAHVLPAMEQQLKLKGYSPSTIKTYLGEMAQLLQLLKNIPADNLQPEHMKRYLIHCYDQLKLTENTLHSRMNAMKFYYEQVLKRDKFFWEIPRPRKQLILPKVLSDAEIGKMFRALTNLKHKAILFTAYSAGLRVSEVINLKQKDIDPARMTLFIERAKGKKDRVVNLSPLLLDILRGYIKQSNPRPKLYLFEGEVAGEPYSARSAQSIFLEARKKAGINKNVSFHALRHSFATHLLEKGVDIRYIKDILGHFNIKTTERYTHVSRRALVNIISPLDDLFSRGIL